jgi:hypothetical protein
MENSYSTYLEKAWGDSIENVVMKDVRTAINETQLMDDEHGAFWVVLENEGPNVLEVSKDLGVIGVFEDDPDIQIKIQAKSWDEIEIFYQILLEGNIQELKYILSNYSGV